MNRDKDFVELNDVYNLFKDRNEFFKPAKIMRTDRGYVPTIDDLLDIDFDIPAMEGKIVWYNKILRYKNKESLNVFNEKVAKLYIDLCDFVNTYKDLYEVKDMHELYYEFMIPKSSGGMRLIQAPTDRLKEAQYQLKYIFESAMDYKTSHNAAYAYVKGRSHIDAAKNKHEGDRWHLQLDFDDFFGSFNLKYALRVLSSVIPFAGLFDGGNKQRVLIKALSLAFLDDKLPQGTPFSPMLTNILMIPFNVYANRYINEHPHQIATREDGGVKDYPLNYTIYADDIWVSCRVKFDHREVIKAFNDILKAMEAPLKFKEKKTKFINCSHGHYILGVMFDNNARVTIGNKKIDRMKAKLHHYFVIDRDENGNTTWDLHLHEVLAGELCRFKDINEEQYNNLVANTEKKYNVDDLIKLINNRIKLMRKQERGR